ncbi:MAG: right-handed parallel beta-helix repeat-containing protein [Methanobacteriota archaeon]
MKKIVVFNKLLIFVLVVLMISTVFSPYSGNAQDTIFINSTPGDQISSDDKIVVTYTISQPLVKPIPDSEYSSIELSGAAFVGIPTEPLLPVLGGRIFVPSGKTVSSIEVTGEKILFAHDVLVVPASESVPISHAEQGSQTRADPVIYASDVVYPEKQVVGVGTYRFRGYDIYVFRLHPVQYIPLEKTLYYTPQFQVTFYLESSLETNQKEVLNRGFADDYFDVEQMVDNPRDVQRYRGQGIEDTSASLSKQNQLLIITTNELRNGFIPLALAHNREGIRTIIRTLGTDISVGADYNQTCENIRDYIRTAYMKWGVEYVLLGGDEDVVPARQLWVDSNIYGYITDMPADIYYACLDGPFNFDGDEKWGEPTDGADGGDVDLLAEVYVGRACVGNLTEVGYFVNKTLWYMNRNIADRFLKNVVMVGEYLTGPSQGDPLVLGDWYMDLLINGSGLYEYNTSGIPSADYIIDKLYDGLWPGFDPYNPWYTGWPKEELIQRINAGVYIINHLGHSGNFYNMRLYVNDVDSLTNTELCFIYSQGCTAGAFDQDAYQSQDCIAEHYTIKTPHAAFAGVWNAREGWFNKQINESSSQRLHREFWDAVFGEGKSVISVANQDSKEDALFLINFDATMRWSYYEVNYFGDPVIAFRNRPLQANAHGPYEVLLSEPVFFHGSAYGGFYPYRWSWNFGDGAISKLKNPVHTYNSYGIRTVTLTVLDGKGGKSTATTTVTIRPPVVWVDDDYYFGGWNDGHDWGTDAFSTIQPAINIVLHDGTIYVANGTYLQNIFINKTVTVIGANPFYTIIDANGTRNAIDINTDSVSITGCAIQNASVTGVVVNGENNTIKYTRIINNHYGIKISSSHNNIFMNSFINTSQTGIEIQLTSYNTITENTFIDQRCGIYILDGSHNTIVGNSFMNNTKTINQGIVLQRSHYNTVTGNHISNALTYGLLLCGSKYNEVTDNSITHCRDGMYIYSESTSHVSKKNNITNNLIMNNSEYGLYCRNYVLDNNFTSNVITDNLVYGVYLMQYSNGNTFIGNTIERNLVYGINFGFASGGNHFYHNNFNNVQNIKLNYGGSNTWDDGQIVGGNYWYNHLCEGNPSDGSQPYTIDGNNIDHYPFQDPDGWLI